MKYVVHCKKEKYDVYIGRPGRWRNPYTIGEDGSREEVIQKFREYGIATGLDIAAKRELKDKVLGCWCAPQSCHGDVLVEWTNASS